LSTESSLDLAESPDLGFAPVSPPPLELVENHGGPVVASPEIITITWQSDPLAAELESFDDWEVTSSFWKDIMGEWGVGPGTHLASWRNPSPAPMTLDEAAIQTMISDAVAAGAVPSPSPSRIYTIYAPSGTTVTELGSYQGCVDFQAYHSSFPFGSTLAIYAVTPRCTDTQGFTALDYTTWGMSHEVMEASNDPDINHPAWVNLTQSDTTPVPGESADLCTGQPMKIDGHEVTRNYSNLAAMNGERPCVPAPTGPMFGVFPDAPELLVASGGSATITLHLYATAPMPPFTVAAYPESTQLTAKLSKQVGQNGDTITLTLTAGSGWSATEPNLVDIYGVISGYQTRRSLIARSR
jgi:hypothetical protein